LGLNFNPTQPTKTDEFTGVPKRIDGYWSVYWIQDIGIEGIMVCREYLNQVNTIHYKESQKKLLRLNELCRRCYCIKLARVLLVDEREAFCRMGLI
jgi:hypothetical protein